MSKDSHQHPHQGLSNGFLMGAIIGGGLVFLFATKKGRQILKTLKENGFEGLHEVTDLLEDTDEEEEMMKEEYTQDGEVVESQKETNESPKKSIKRFFRRIKK